MTKEIPVTAIEPNPKNPNSMPPTEMQKLQRHIERTGFYPPLIVRPVGGTGKDARYMMVDGWHRYLVLRDGLQLQKVTCVVADVSEAEANMMLATLNRLHGEDDPRKRAELVSDLLQEFGSVVALADLLPESANEINDMLKNLGNGFVTEPEPEPEPGKKKTLKLQFDNDQWLVIGEALSVMRRRAELPEGQVERCLELLCADWLGGLSGEERATSMN
jgi:ParB-like chromosome segregation protein Spo0J